MSSNKKRKENISVREPERDPVREPERERKRRKENEIARERTREHRFLTLLNDPACLS